MDSTLLVLGEVAAERRRQESKFPAQELPDGTGAPAMRLYADIARQTCEDSAVDGSLTWWDVLHEEWAEAGAELALEGLRADLIQVAAVSVRWVESIDRRIAARKAAA